MEIRHSWAFRSVLEKLGKPPAMKEIDQVNRAAYGDHEEESGSPGKQENQGHADRENHPPVDQGAAHLPLPGNLFPGSVRQ